MSDSDSCDLLCLDLPLAEEIRSGQPDITVILEASESAKALADPTRLGVACALRRAELCVCDLAWICQRSDKLISHHARALRTAGLVTSRRDGKMVMYSLSSSGIALLDVLLSEKIEVAG